MKKTATTKQTAKKTAAKVIATTKPGRVAKIIRHNYFDKWLVAELVELGKDLNRSGKDILTEIVNKAIINGFCSGLQIYSDGKNIISGDWTATGRERILKLQNCVAETVKLASKINARAANCGLPADAELPMIKAWVDLINELDDMQEFLMKVFYAAIVYPQMKDKDYRIYPIHSRAHSWRCLYNVIQGISDNADEEKADNYIRFSRVMLNIKAAIADDDISPEDITKDNHYYDITTKDTGNTGRYRVSFSGSNKENICHWVNIGANGKVRYTSSYIAVSNIASIKLSTDQETR